MGRTCSILPAIRLEAEIEICEVLDWHTNDDYSVQQNDNLELREPGTGGWFLQTLEFEDWVESPGKLLFYPSIAGAGKTTIASIVVDYPQEEYENDPNCSVAYIYFNHMRLEKQTIRHLLATLLRQLSENATHLHSLIRYLYQKHRKERKRPSVNALVQGLDESAGLQSRQFIVVDALDE